jgi:hypothetical protein
MTNLIPPEIPAPPPSAPPAHPAALRDRSAELRGTTGTHLLPLRKIFEARMISSPAPRPPDAPVRPPVPLDLHARHAQFADALRAQSERRRQHQIGAIRLQQIRRTHIRPNRLAISATTFIRVSAGWKRSLRGVEGPLRSFLSSNSARHFHHRIARLFSLIGALPCPTSDQEEAKKQPQQAAQPTPCRREQSRHELAERST